MVKIIDRRKQSMGGSSKRSTSQIKNIAVHYSATTEGNTASFERHWNSGGYHEVVLTNGNVELNYDANVISNGVGGQNTRMYNICYVGSGKPNIKQLKSLRKKVNHNRKRFNISTSNVKGHREFSGQSTQCPALDMGAFRQSLVKADQPVSEPSKPYTTKPKTSTNNLGLVDYMVRQKMDSSYNNRKKLAVRHGIKGYRGTESQNTNLLAKIKGNKLNASTTTKPKANLKVDGYWERLTTLALQRYFQTTRDGVISKPSNVIRALQKLLGVKEDGYIGPCRDDLE